MKKPTFSEVLARCLIAVIVGVAVGWLGSKWQHGDTFFQRYWDVLGPIIGNGAEIFVTLGVIVLIFGLLMPPKG